MAKSCRNLKAATALPVSQATAYDVLLAETVVLTASALAIVTGTSAADCQKSERRALSAVTCSESTCSSMERIFCVAIACTMSPTRANPATSMGASSDPGT